jgi:hypothetical protein
MTLLRVQKTSYILECIAAALTLAAAALLSLRACWL